MDTNAAPNSISDTNTVHMETISFVDVGAEVGSTWFSAPDMNRALAISLQKLERVANCAFESLYMFIF